MTPLVSRLFHGPVISGPTDLVPGQATLGRPAWNPGALLQNLELRLGLPARSPCIFVPCNSAHFDDHIGIDELEEALPLGARTTYGINESVSRCTRIRTPRLPV
jgi:hypothetical protein